MRLRSVLAGQNPFDLGLDPRYVTFDSSWLNSFRVRANGVVSGAALGGATIGYGLGAAYRDVRVLSVLGANGPGRPTLAWQRNNGGSLSSYPGGAGSSGEPLGYQRGYGVCGVTLRDNEIHISPSKPAHDYVYFVFEVSPSNWEAGGAGGWVRGNHPLHGLGLYIARPGVNPLTASLDDMMMTTQRHHFQIAQTGITGGPTHLISGDPFPTHTTTALRQGFLIDLGRSYPHYPPVIAFPTDYSGGIGELSHRHSCSIFWITPSQIMVLSSFGSAPIRWAVVGSDPAYQPGVGALVRRIYQQRGLGLFVTKHGVDYFSAGANDFIFRSDMQSPRFSGLSEIPTGAPTGYTPYPLPNPPPAGGPPFAFMLVYEPQGGWWCGCGLTVMQDVIRYTPSPTLGAYYGPFFSGLVYSRDQYKWYRNPDYSVSYIGYASTMNVSDFS